MEKCIPPRSVFGKQCFGDLNIPTGPKCRHVCEAAIAVGYKLLALNTPVVATSCLPQKPGGGKKAKKRKLEEKTGGILSATAAQTGQDGVPPPKRQDWIADLMEKHKDVRILQRLTVIFYDINHLQTVLSQENVALYEIIAVVPTNHEALVSCVISSLVFDVISFDIEGPHWINKVKLNRQKGKVAAEKDVHFEITYSPSFHGDEPLENMVYIADRLKEDICTRKIKNIIISSGASAPDEIRSPQNVLGIGYLLGFDETTTRICIREHVERIVKKGDSRKFGKSWVAFTPTEQKEKVVE
ncbi:Ribonuclease P protein subunit p30 [Orchesella cincta]|uniref:Ribonuclease P protein subunit p30 n=1 Tax=Orchesella cincta TaxID=48709 RepID=A0A1D2NGD4_ORCCI|nr:Ribonuclease P protein subunit p30 [Orchesella cincta]